MATTWTRTMDTILKEMVKAAQPMVAIAARLGLNRNKVIGRSNRLGLRHPHAKNVGQRKLPSRGDGHRYLKSTKVNGNANMPVTKANGHEILFSDRRSDQCAFIVGDADLLKTKCCGRQVYRKSWCENHYRELFTNPKDK